MSHPQTQANTSFQEFLQVLPPDTQELAYKFQSFTRSRKVRTPFELLRLVFMYCAVDLTLRDTASDFTLLQQKISDTAVKKRLLACTPWVRALLQKMLSSHQFQQCKNGGRLLLTDGSVIAGPGAKGVDWRIHIVIDLFRLEFVHFEVTDDKNAESLQKVPISPGDIVLADRGYCRQVPLLSVVEAGGHALLRAMLKTVFLDPKSKEQISLVEELKKRENAQCASFRVLFAGHKSKKHVEGWIHAQRLPKEIADKKRRKTRAHRKKKCKGEPKKETLYMAGWIVIFCTVPPEELAPGEALELYKFRWQVELSIKRLKSLLHLSEIRCRKGSALGELWLLGKLLYAICLEKKLRKVAPQEWQNMMEQREQSMWGAYRLMHKHLTSVLIGSDEWDFGRFEEALEVRKERSRRRKLTRVPQISFLQDASSGCF